MESYVPASDDELISVASDLLSDDSSFYGGDEARAECEQKLAEFNPTDFLEFQKWNLQYLALQERAVVPPPKPQGIKRKREDTSTPKSKKTRDLDAEAVPIKTEKQTLKDDSSSTGDQPTPSPSPSPFNPYEGDEMARQLDETVDDFLTRLPPSTTSINSGPWIWIANPTQPRDHHGHSPDISGFKESGLALLDEYISRKRQLEEENPSKAAASITRMLKPDREQLEQSIISLARSKHVTSGKWMLFPSPNTVDDVWRKVCHATAVTNTLGNAAKVATDDGNAQKPERLVCVYTCDFSDVKDVSRVLDELKRLRLVSGDADARPIYYKCDAHTYLDIVSGNDYKLKASMYCSRDLFAERARGR